MKALTFIYFGIKIGHVVDQLNCRPLDLSSGQSSEKGGFTFFGLTAVSFFRGLRIKGR